MSENDRITQIRPKSVEINNASIARQKVLGNTGKTKIINPKSKIRGSGKATA